NYSVSGGLHGVGSSVVNALSEQMTVLVRREGKEYQQSYARGVPQTKLKELAATRKRGTETYFRPDPQIFGKTLKFDPEVVKERLESKSYLHRGLKVVFRDLSSGSVLTFEHPGGIVDYLQKVVADKKMRPVHAQVFALERESDPRLELSLM